MVLAEVAGFSIPHFHRVITARTRESAVCHIRRMRMGAVDSTEVARAAGYESHAAFSKAFKKQLEPNAGYPAMKALRESLVKDGIPFTAFEVNDIQSEHERMRKLGVEFTMEPTNMGPTTAAVLNDTCGNLIKIHQLTGG